MRKVIISLFLCIIASSFSFAQSLNSVGEEIENLGTEQQLDSTLLAKDFFSVLPDNVIVYQSSDISKALDQYIASNEDAIFNGFRVRIFLDSGKNSREASLSTIRRFNSMYPGIPAFRSYSAPNFKVTVGNFRTKLEAERFLREIKSIFPEAFVVRDKFKYPTIGQPDMTPAPEEESDSILLL